MAEEVELISLGKKLTEKYLLDPDDYVYCVEKVDGETAYLQCTELGGDGPTCEGSAIANIQLENEELSKFTGFLRQKLHNHAPNPTKVANAKMWQNCYEKIENEKLSLCEKMYKEGKERFPLSNITQESMVNTLFRCVTCSQPLTKDNLGAPITLVSKKRKRLRPVFLSGSDDERTGLDSVEGGENCDAKNDSTASARAARSVRRAVRRLTLPKKKRKKKLIPQEFCQIEMGGNDDVELITFDNISKKTYVIHEGKFMYLICHKRRKLYLGCIKSRRYWESHCKGTAFATPHYDENGQLVRLTNFITRQEHNHEFDMSDIHAVKLRFNCYKRAELEKDVPLAQIYDEEIERYPLANLSLKNVEKAMQRCRTGCLSQEDLGEDDPPLQEEQFNNTSQGVPSTSQTQAVIPSAVPPPEIPPMMYSCQFDDGIQIIDFGDYSSKKYVVDRDNFVYFVTKLSDTANLRCIKLSDTAGRCEVIGHATPHFDAHYKLTHLTNLVIRHRHNHGPDLVDVHNLKLWQSCYQRATVGRDSFAAIFFEETQRYPYANIKRDGAYDFMKKSRMAAEQKQLEDRPQEAPRDYSEQGLQQYGDVPADVELVVFGKPVNTRYVLDDRNYVYSISKLKERTANIFCAKMSWSGKECKASGMVNAHFVDGQLTHVSDFVLRKPHCHPPNLGDIHSVKLRQVCYHRTEAEPLRTIMDIYEEESPKYPLACHKISKKAVIRMMEKLRGIDKSEGEGTDGVYASGESQEEPPQTLKAETVCMGKIVKKKYILDENSHVYRIVKIQDNSVSLVCLNGRKGQSACKATASATANYKDEELTDVSDFMLLKSHNHEPDIGDVQSVRLRHICYQRAEKEPHKSIPDIYGEEIKKYPYAKVSRRAVCKFMDRIKSGDKPRSRPRERVTRGSYNYNSKGKANRNANGQTNTTDPPQSQNVEMICMGKKVKKKYMVDEHNHVYVIVKMGEKIAYLVCLRRRRNGAICKATATVRVRYEDGNLVQVSEFVLLRPHNHPSDIGDVQALRLKYHCYLRAEADLIKTSNEIYNEEIERFPLANISKRNICRAMDKMRAPRDVPRRKQRPPQPPPVEAPPLIQQHHFPQQHLAHHQHHPPHHLPPPHPHHLMHHHLHPHHPIHQHHHQPNQPMGDILEQFLG